MKRFDTSVAATMESPAEKPNNMLIESKRYHLLKRQDSMLQDSDNGSVRRARRTKLKACLRTALLCFGGYAKFL